MRVHSTAPGAPAYSMGHRLDVRRPKGDDVTPAPNAYTADALRLKKTAAAFTINASDKWEKADNGRGTDGPGCVGCAYVGENGMTDCA